MYSVSDNDIVMTRGDTVKLKVTIGYEQTGTPYEPVEGDIIRFSCKKYVSDKKVLITKDVPIDSLYLILDPDDTKDLNFGIYHYDMQLIKSNGETSTFIENKILRIGPEVD